VCLGKASKASGIGKHSDSRYSLILGLIEAVKEIPSDPRPNDRREKGEA